MKPIKLVMSAFGPYSKVQEIDFSKLDDSNIFLITGPTGAGKTTIFDAISYGLYGETSGSTREVDSLRSDFAKGDIETYVELDFEFRDEKYKIKRYPTQTINKKRGEGLKEEKARVELYLPNGKVITKVKEATDKIQDILGIDKDQFKQIVMIPQGEFKKLLLADSKERGVIFRKIFGTYDFEKIQNNLKEKADNMKKGVQSYNDEISINVKGIKSKDNIVIQQDLNTKQYLDIIENILNEDKKLYDEESSKLKDLKDKNGKLNEALIKAEQINQLLKEYSDTKIKLEELNSLKNKIEEDRVILSNGKRAKLVETSEMLYSQKSLDKKNKEENLTKLNDEALKSLDRLNNAKLNLENELKNEPIKEQLNKEIISLKEKLIQLEGLEAKQQNIKALEAKLNYSDESLKAKESMLSEEKKYKDKKEEEIKQVLIIEKQLIEKENQHRFTKEKIQKLLDLFDDVKKYNDEKDVFEEKSKERIVIDKNYSKALELFERLDMNFKLGQAGLLAQGLNEGEGCPVCGSTTHPNKAMLLNDMPTEKDLKQAKDNLEMKREIRDKFYNGLEVQKNTVKIKEEDIKDIKIKEIFDKYNIQLTFDSELQNKIKEIGTEIRKELTGVEDEIKVINANLAKTEELEKELKVSRETIEKLDKEITQTREYKLNLVSECSKEKEAVNSILKEIPEEFRDINKLNEHINLKVFKFEEYKNKIDVAQKHEIEEAKKHSSIVAQIDLAKSDISNLEKDLIELSKKYELALSENNFTSEDQYKKCKIDQYILIELEKNITQYDNTYSLVKEKNEELASKTRNQKNIETEEIQNEIKELSGLIVGLEKDINIIYARYENNKQRQEQIMIIYEKIRVLEEKYSVIGQLANYANGKTSPYITFESYVLAVYFKQIIDAANIRLSKMTAGRFMLKRKEDKGKGAGQKGLDLEVFDNYTGKLRGVSTLSGGESFKASLSLALGLSDIIQMNAGGIKLDTMFIDEGFGTLDPESLDNAVGCLLELQKGGRLVGVISHVPELKERIERKLNIITTPEGSVATFN